VRGPGFGPDRGPRQTVGEAAFLKGSGFFVCVIYYICSRLIPVSILVTLREEKTRLGKRIAKAVRLIAVPSHACARVDRTPSLSTVSGGAGTKRKVTMPINLGFFLTMRRAASGAALLASCGLALAQGAPAQSAQTPTAPVISSQGIEGTWQGTLHVPQRDLRIVTKISIDEKGKLKVSNFSIDQGGGELPATSASYEDKTLKFSVDTIAGKYEGRMSGDGMSISGTWTQGPNPVPLVYVRATPATAWEIPPPPKRLDPMAASSDPSFEIATIKPSKPDQPGKGLIVRPNAEFGTINTTLADVIEFAYGLHEKQIVGGPDWIHSTKFDITGKPDTPGMPNDKQLKLMVQKLLRDRFQLTFHSDERELSAYVLSVAKAGNKMKEDTADPDGLPGLFFQGLGVLSVRNARMEDFTGLLQSAVLDRPVVDRTNLQGRWDFLLKWTPDESQFGGRVPPPQDPPPADAPPPLFTAIQEQIGLRLEAAKTSVKVIVLDHLEQPSEN
jgi:bla regulator protein blaR1